LARNITKKRDVNDCSFAHLTLIMLLRYLVKCRYSVNHSNINYCVDGSIWHFPKTKVVQTDTLGEFGILSTVLMLGVSGKSFQFLLKLVNIWQTGSKR